MSGDAKNFVECKISQKKIIVFSKTYCPYASKAKQVFNTFVKTGVITSDTLEIIELDELAECNLIVAYLKKITGKSSIPRVFIYGKCIGGGDETVAMNHSGELMKLIEQH